MIIDDITVDKIGNAELDKFAEFLMEVGGLVKEFDHLSKDSPSANQVIGKLVRKAFPHHAAFLAPMNLAILLDSYQDSDSDKLVHPKWIDEMFTVFKILDECISASSQFTIDNGSVLHQTIKKFIPCDHEPCEVEIKEMISFEDYMDEK